tara:strand:- start:49 stop:498 length:450 start_codon:yes stop_codon:yes gene_type:complete
MKRRGLNKKGAETSPLSVIITIIILAVVAITVIYFFTGGFGQLTSKFELLPSDVEALAQACGGYASAGFVIDYCAFRDVKDDNYINCKYIYDEYKDKYDFENIDNCDTEIDGVNPAVDFCNKNFKANKIQKIFVNGKTCGGHGATGIVE